jgi:hypothetical protein
VLQNLANYWKIIANTFGSQALSDSYNLFDGFKGNSSTPEVGKAATPLQLFLYNSFAAARLLLKENEVCSLAVCTNSSNRAYSFEAEVLLPVTQTCMAQPD